ncbi:MAG: hypothetical protein D3926_00550 [Desulfobacteraceae bacterium]|nr:MAG: hypothetical protein D3926_00550 [Desulfobacteraceae bacterium]
MSIKVNHYWSVVPKSQEEYQKFVIKKFIPGINHLGMHTVAVWSVIVGEFSEIICETACSDLEWVEKALTHKRYRALKTDLLRYVNGYHTKVLLNTGKVSSYTMDIHEDAVKFNQMWDVRSHKTGEYEYFMTHDYIPSLKEIGISVAGEWEVIIGDGPGIICEGRVSDVATLIYNLRSRQFQDKKRELKQLVENYRSRILAFHARKIKSFRSTSYQLVNP